MPLVKVTGTNFVRDTRSMALINTDEMARNEYYTKAKLLKTQKDEINKVKSEIDTIRVDMVEIKSLLYKLLEKGSNG
jgi:gluconate kinase